MALHDEIPFSVPIELIGKMRRAGFRLVEPSASELLKAEQIARSKSPSQGHSQLQDSIYHAIAIERAATFVTADARDVARAKSFGHVMLLADWSPA